MIEMAILITEAKLESRMAIATGGRKKRIFHQTTGKI